MSENETPEKRIFFEELGSIRSDIVNRGGGSERASDAPSILLSGSGGSILKEVTDSIRSGGKGEVGLRRDEGREAKDGGENDEEEGDVGVFA